MEIDEKEFEGRPMNKKEYEKMFHEEKDKWLEMNKKLLNSNFEGLKTEFVLADDLKVRQGELELLKKYPKITPVTPMARG